MTNQAIPEGNGGWIKLHRRFLDSREFGSNPATFKVCIYLMLAANHKLRYVRGITVERGQCIRSLSMISDDCSLSRKAVRCALGNLERSGFIHVDAPFGAQQGHRVSVCNYATYQGGEADKGTEGISEGYHEGNTNKNGKKEKKVRQQELLPPNGGEGASGTSPGQVPDCSVSVSASASGLEGGCKGGGNDGATPIKGASKGDVYTCDFEQFWGAYPRKVAKKKAFKAWNGAKDKPDVQAIIKAVETHKASEQWRKDGGQFIPHPATWLNAGQWEDVVTIAMKAKPAADSGLVNTWHDPNPDITMRNAF